MKKKSSFLTLLLAAGAMATVLSACGSSPAPSSESSPENAGKAEAESVETAAPSGSLTLRVNMSESAESNKSKAIQAVKAEIEKNTEGRILIEIHNNGELGTFADDIEAISGGANIIDGTSPSAYCDYGNPDLMALDLMFGLQSYEDCDKLNSSELFKEMTAPLESASHIKVLAVNWGNMPRCILSNKQIRSAEDIKGLIIRTPLANYISFFTRLGATTQSMSLADTYTALQQGAIDACEFGYDTLYNHSMYEVARYCFADEHAYAPSMWCMNSDLFHSLSADDRQAVLTAFYNGGVSYEKMNMENQEEYRKKLEEAGVSFVEPSEADRELMLAAARDSANDFELSDGILDRIDQALGR